MITQISKDLTDTVNFSTTSEFFGQFRTLHEDLLERFREAVFKLWQGSVHPLLYPILNILSRSDLTLM